MLKESAIRDVMLSLGYSLRSPRQLIEDSLSEFASSLSMAGWAAMGCRGAASCFRYGLMGISRRRGEGKSDARPWSTLKST
jgi:hypothetical protein